MLPNPYHPISQHYHRLFGRKTLKIPVSVVDDCPNRRGLKGMQTCVFCDPWGSAARVETMTLELRDQIERVRGILSERHKAQDYLVYFQAYTNTFTKVAALRANFETALSFPFVRGLVIGTRPDCLSKSVLDLWREFHHRSFVAVELGVQTFDDEQLRFLRRGHSADDSLRAIEKISEATGVDLGIHLMFGLPGETDEQIIETARRCNDLPITNVKLHNLHVLRATPLEEMFARGEFTPIELPEYADRVRLFLENLSPRIAVHRLAALSSRPEELVAPSWTGRKMGTHQAILDHLGASESYQSKTYAPRDEEEASLQKNLLLAARQRAPSTRRSTGSSTISEGFVSESDRTRQL